jgi:hypothetical protein
MLSLILLVVSFLCLILAAAEVGIPRVQLGWLGLALYVLTFVLKAGGA